jgi:HK97 family phage major capsid protein
VTLAAIALSRPDAHMDLPRAAALLAKTFGDRSAALDLARSEANNSRVVNYLKAAQAAGTRENWAAALDENDAIVAAFSASLRQRSAFARAMAEGAVDLPFATRCTVEAVGATAWLSGEGAAIPVSALSPEAIFLERRRAGAIVVISKELATSPQAEPIVARELQRAVAEVLDDAFFAEVVTATTSLNLASGGTTAAKMRADLAAMIDALDPDEASRFIWVAAPNVAAKLAVIGTEAAGSTIGTRIGLNGQLLGWPLLINDGMTAGTLRLIDVSRIAARLESIELSASDETTIEMDTAPTNNSASPTGTSVVSLWQTNSVGVLAKAYYGVKRLRSNVAATLSGIAWEA